MSIPSFSIEGDKPIEVEIAESYIPFRGQIGFRAFEMAYMGYKYYSSNGTVHNDTVIIIDYDLPSTEPRMFVVDLSENKILHQSLVAHGKNSGENMALQFSNIEGSLQSSVGFFRTGERYQGKHGLSLRLDGLERGVNDEARTRNIVIHSADYVSKKFIAENQRLGRSFGCPALPEEEYPETLDLMDDQVLLFIFSSHADYHPAFDM